MLFLLQLHDGGGITGVGFSLSNLQSWDEKLKDMNEVQL